MSKQERSVALMASACVLVSACSGPRPPESSCATTAAAIGGAAARLIVSDNARDLAGVLAGYTDDITWLPPTGEVLSGKHAIRPRYEDLFSGFTVDLSSETVEARADGKLGFVRGFTTGMLTPLDGSAAVTVNDKFLALVRCENDEWRVSHLMWSPRD